MKRWISFALLLLTAAMLFSLAACSPSSPEEQPDQPDEPEIPTITLAENGEPLYRVVRGDRYAVDSPPVTCAVRVTSALKAILGKAPTILTDWEDKDDNAAIKEILVGKTNRAESEAVYATLEDDEYVIRVSGNKIVIAGGSDDLLNYAVTVFLRDYCQYLSASSFTAASTLVIPETLNIKETYVMPGKITLYSTKNNVSYLNALSDALVATGAALTTYGPDADPAEVFDAAATDLVLMVGADTVKSTTMKALENYLKKDGRVLFLGGPAFETVLYELDGDWLDRSDYAHELLEMVDEDDRELLLNFSDPAFVKKHSRSTSHAGNAYEAVCDDFDLNDGSDAQLYHYVDKMENWDMLHYSGLNIKGKGYNAIGFYAMPDNSATDGFVFEIKDKNGARWYANVTFTSNDWSYYMLMPSDFTWWQDGAKPDGDVPNFDNITSVQIGFANSFRGLAVGSYAYYCSDVYLFACDRTLPSTADKLTLEGVSPMHEVYPITNAANLLTCENQVFLTERDYVIPTELFSCHPGRTGTGYAKGATNRFIPLIRVTDEKGLHSGYAAWMYLLAGTTTKNGAFEGAMIGTFSASSADFYNVNGISAVVETAQAMLGKAFLVDGGTTEHIYVTVDTESITAGTTYAAYGDVVPLAKVELYQGETLLSTVQSDTTAPKSAKNDLKTLSTTYALSGGKPDRAVVTLSVNGKVVDTLVQEISYWEAKPESERSYVYMEDGYFKKDGKIITMYGVNYMPSYDASEADGALFEHYISDAAYDPEVIMYDLQHIKDIGMNAVSIFCYYEYVKDCNNILDLVNKCEEMGLYVDLSIRPYAYPLRSNYSYDQVKTLIQRLHFHENETIVAYDIAWEPRIGDNYEENGMYIGRQRWEDEWLQWIKDNYGSVKAAETAWGCTTAKCGNGAPKITNEIIDDTSKRYAKLMAAYYAFIDEVVAAEMQVFMPEMQALAPNQLISFRMSMSGSTMRNGGYVPSLMCFDFQSLASTMAFMEPEGYALGLSDEVDLQIMFANAYARYVKPDAPVVWKEFGRHVWTGMENGNFDPSDALLQTQADYYRYALDYCLTSYSSGMFCWYYAGGFRIGENSDYGILNPDGSDRPVTKLLREYAPKFINQGERGEVVEIAIERDDYVGGLFGMFDAVKSKLAAAYKAGKAVTFINKQQDNAATYAYADELVNYAVADAKAGDLYPLRYVGGQIMQITFEGNVAKITVCNTKQSTWRAGTVSIVSTADSKLPLRVTIDQDLGYLEQTTIEVPISGSGALSLRFEIEGHAFGIRYTTTK